MMMKLLSVFLAILAVSYRLEGSKNNRFSGFCGYGFFKEKTFGMYPLP